MCLISLTHLYFVQSYPFHWGVLLLSGEEQCILFRRSLTGGGGGLESASDSEATEPLPLWGYEMESSPVGPGWW